MRWHVALPANWHTTRWKQISDQSTWKSMGWMHSLEVNVLGWGEVLFAELLALNSEGSFRTIFGSDLWSFNPPRHNWSISTFHIVRLESGPLQSKSRPRPSRKGAVVKELFARRNIHFRVDWLVSCLAVPGYNMMWRGSSSPLHSRYSSKQLPWTSFFQHMLSQAPLNVRMSSLASTRTSLQFGEYADVLQEVPAGIETALDGVCGVFRGAHLARYGTSDVWLRLPCLPSLTLMLQNLWLASTVRSRMRRLDFWGSVRPAPIKTAISKGFQIRCGPYRLKSRPRRHKHGP